MPIIQTFISHDDLFNRTNTKVILNDIKVNHESIRDLIHTTYDDVIPLVPQCECSKLNKGYLVGKVCQECQTEVTKPFDNVAPILWIRKFDDDIKFINPKFWLDLSKTMFSKFDGLRWLADSSYAVKDVPQLLYSLSEIIGGRSYTNVINNIEKIILHLKNSSQMKTVSKQIKLQSLLEIYKSNKHMLFNDYIPLINKKLFVLERTNKGSYTNILLADIIDIAMLAVDTANDVVATRRKYENSTAKSISKLSLLFNEYVKTMVGRKGGLIRRNVYATRAHLTFRTVMSSLGTDNDYDIIKVPWVILTSTFRPHVINKLMKKGYTYKEASLKTFEACVRYDEEIAEIGRDLIKESPEKGIPVLANRNPTLKMGSIQKVFITEFKEDVLDNTTSISILIATSFNLDFDGNKLVVLAIIKP